MSLWPVALVSHSRAGWRGLRSSPGAPLSPFPRDGIMARADGAQGPGLEMVAVQTGTRSAVSGART